MSRYESIMILPILVFQRCLLYSHWSLWRSSAVQSTRKMFRLKGIFIMKTFLFLLQWFGGDCVQYTGCTVYKTCGCTVSGVLKTEDDVGQSPADQEDLDTRLTAGSVGTQMCWASSGQMSVITLVNGRNNLFFVIFLFFWNSESCMNQIKSESLKKFIPKFFFFIKYRIKFQFNSRLILHQNICKKRKSFVYFSTLWAELCCACCKL